MEQQTTIEDFVIAMNVLGCKVRFEINAPAYAVLVITGSEGEVEASFYGGLLGRFWVDGHTESDIWKVKERLLGRFWQNRLSPTVVMTRVLKALGLSNRQSRNHRKDFSISGLYVRKERLCTYVNFYGKETEARVAQCAAQIGRISELVGISFSVRVKTLADGREYTTMSNSAIY